MGYAFSWSEVNRGDVVGGGRERVTVKETEATRVWNVIGDGESVPLLGEFGSGVVVTKPRFRGDKLGLMVGAGCGVTLWAVDGGEVKVDVIDHPGLLMLYGKVGVTVVNPYSDELGTGSEYDIGIINPVSWLLLINDGTQPAKMIELKIEKA